MTYKLYSSLELLLGVTVQGSILVNLEQIIHQLPSYQNSLGVVLLSCPCSSIVIH